MRFEISGLGSFRVWSLGLGSFGVWSLGVGSFGVISWARLKL